jgi:hypothetical protein
MSNSHCLQRVTRSEDPLTTNPKINLNIPRTGTCIVHAVAGLYAVPRDPLCVRTREKSHLGQTQCPGNTLNRRDVTRSVLGNSHCECGFMGSTAARRSSKGGTRLAKNFHRLAPRERFAESMHQTNVFRNSTCTYVGKQSRSTSNCAVWSD